MPSTPSPLLNVELQATGEKLAVWGSDLNQAVLRLTEAIADVKTIAVSGPVTLDNSLYVPNQARSAGFIFTGTGGAVTVPAKTKVYKVVNIGTGTVTMTTGSGLVGAFQGGEYGDCICDGTNFYKTASNLIDVSQAFSATSSTANAISTGTKTYTVQSGRAFTIGTGVRITDNANPTVNFMTGTVTDYSGTSLTVNVTAIGGSGTPATVTIAFNQATVGLPSQLGQDWKVLSTTAGVAAWVEANTVARRTLVSVANVTAAATVDFTNLSAEFSYYEIDIISLLPSTGSPNLLLVLSQNNGVSFDSGAADYNYFSIVSFNSSVTPVNAPSTSAISISGQCTADAPSGGFRGRVRISSALDATKYTAVEAFTHGPNTTANRAIASASGSRLAAAATNAVRIYPSGGTLTGTLMLWGVRQ